MLGWNPSLSSLNRKFHLLLTEVSVQGGRSCLPFLLGWNPSLSSFNSKFHLLLTEVSVQGAALFLAYWVGIPVYQFIYF